MKNHAFLGGGGAYWYYYRSSYLTKVCINKVVNKTSLSKYVLQKILFQIYYLKMLCLI